MRYHVWIVAACVAAGLLAGCSQATPGTTRILGQVEPDLAFAAAREVMGQYFPIANADPLTRVIRSRPKSVEAGPDRLLGGYPARQLATLRLRQEGKVVVAHLSVAEQRQRSPMHRGLRQMSDNYDGVPNRTPAYDEAATTVEQNEAWETPRYDHALEARILNDIYKALHADEEP